MKKNNKISTFSWIIQFIFLFILINFVTVAIKLNFEYIQDYDRKDKWLLSNIIEGDYADFFNTYHMISSNTDLEAPEFIKFKEFEEYYNYYILYIETINAYDFDTNKDLQKFAKECQMQMNQISTNSEFSEFQPHYEYLNESIQ